MHEVSASYDHTRPALQRQMARNAELLFWSNLPAAWLAAAIVPHLAFTMAQAAWRLARGRLGPFALGKLDAVRELPRLPARRAARRHLARRLVAPPHFPLTIAPLATSMESSEPSCARS